MIYISSFLVIIFSSIQVFAASICVGPSSSGSGTGADWNNIAQWSSLSPVRGNTYYLQDGSYASKTINTAPSGSTYIYFKKAIESDHGSATGWSSSYGDGQAVIAGLAIDTDYVEIDGQTGKWASDWPGYEAYGIAITRAIGSSGYDNLVAIGEYGDIANYVTFKHIDASYSNTTSGWYNGGTILYLYIANCTFQWNHLHNSSQNVVYHNAGGSGVSTFEYNLIEKNGQYSYYGGNGLSHSVLMKVHVDDTVIRYNVFRKFRSSGGLLLDGVIPNGCDNTLIYGNIFTLNDATFDGGGNGALNGYGGTTYNGTLVYNNTFVNIEQGGTILTIGTHNTTEIKNNIFYYIRGYQGTGGLSFGAVTLSYNWFYDVVNDFSGQSNAQIGTGDPFVSQVGLNYHLSASTNAGINLGSPYNSDMDGVIRGLDGTWDRGAYEYGGVTTRKINNITGGKINGISTIKINAN